MKTLYININNESIFSDDEREVIYVDLDNIFFHYLGSKIAKNCKVAREVRLVTDFNSTKTKKDYQQILLQWKECKKILFSNVKEREFKFNLPKSYIQWLKCSENEEYNTIFNANFTNEESVTISIDMADLYEDTVSYLQNKIIRVLKKNNFYNEIDRIIFNDDIVNKESSIVCYIIEKYKNIQYSLFCQYKELINNLDKNTCKNNNKKIEQTSIKEAKLILSVDLKNDESIVVNWLCEEFLKESGVDWREDQVMMKNLFYNVRNVLNVYKKNGCADVCIPYVAKRDEYGNPIYRTHFKRILTEHIYKMLQLEMIDTSKMISEDFNEGVLYLWRLENGMIVCREKYKYGLINEMGEYVLPCEYEDIKQLKSGNIRIKKNGKYGVINTNKSLNISCQYDDLFDIEDGLFKVEILNTYYKIDHNGMILYKYENNEWRTVGLSESIFIYASKILEDVYTKLN